MKVLVLVAHPNFQSSHMNKTLTQSLKGNDNITIHVLDKTNYTQKDIEEEKELYLAHDKIVFEYPLYYFNWPAVLQAYFEQVFYTGISRQDPRGHKKIMSFVVTNGATENYYSKHDVEVLQGPGKMTVEFAGVKYGGFLMISPDQGLGKNVIDKYQQFVNKE